MTILEVVNDDPNGFTTEQICKALGATPQQLGSEFEELRVSKKLLGFAGLWLTPRGYVEGKRRLLAQKGNGDLESAVSAAGLTWKGKPLQRITATLGDEAKGFKPKADLTPKQRRLLDRVSAALDEGGVQVPPPSILARQMVMPVQAVDEILRLGAESGEVIKVGEGIFYTFDKLKSFEALLKGVKSPAEARRRLGATRKYADAIFGHLNRHDDDF
jgi:selenocysteine-specific elongation factor